MEASKAAQEEEEKQLAKAEAMRKKIADAEAKKEEEAAAKAAAEEAEPSLDEKTKRIIDERKAARDAAVKASKLRYVANDKADTVAAKRLRAKID